MRLNYLDYMEESSIGEKKKLNPETDFQYQESTVKALKQGDMQLKIFLGRQKNQDNRAVK